MYTLVVDGSCVGCSDLGRRVSNLSSADQLSVINSSGERFKALQATSQQPLTAPCLVRVEDDVVVRKWSGWAMRLRLGSILGVSNAKHWPALMFAEMRARDIQERGGLSRRTLLLGSLGAGLAGAIGVGSTAAAEPSEQKTFAADSSRTRGFIASSAAATTAEANWGSVRSLTEFKRGGKPYVVLTHIAEEPTSSVFLDDNDPDFGAITLVVNRQRELVDYHLPSGSYITSLDLKKRATITDKRSSLETQERSLYVCFKDCVSGSVDFDCFTNCLNCGLLGPLDCALCGICAGGAGVACIRYCRGRNDS